MATTPRIAKKPFLILILLGYLSWSLQAAAEYSEKCMDENYIYQEADTIVLGEVIKVESKYEEGNKGPYTYMDFKVDRYIKGSGDNIITVKQFGGTIRETTIESPDNFTHYTVGERGYLHLRKSKNSYGFYGRVCRGGVSNEPLGERIKQ